MDRHLSFRRHSVDSNPSTAIDIYRLFNCTKYERINQVSALWTVALPI
jgi:hypothetical protein